MGLGVGLELGVKGVSGTQILCICSTGISIYIMLWQYCGRVRNILSTSISSKIYASAYKDTCIMGALCNAVSAAYQCFSGWVYVLWGLTLNLETSAKDARFREWYFCRRLSTLKCQLWLTSLQADISFSSKCFRTPSKTSAMRQSHGGSSGTHCCEEDLLLFLSRIATPGSIFGCP